MIVITECSGVQHPMVSMLDCSGVTRGGRVAHPWKVWGKFWKEGGKEEKEKGEGQRGGKGKERQGKKGKWRGQEEKS